jgi:hypothetical protein
MRKKHIVWLLLLVTAAGLPAQPSKVLEFHGGRLDPKGTPAGTILGLQYGLNVDERVDVALGVDVFHKGYTKTTEVNQGTDATGTTWTTVQKELEYNTTLIPISLTFTARIPIRPPFFWYLGGGLAYELLFDKYNNLKENTSEKRSYKGLGWLGRVGGEYQIGSRSSLRLEVFYNACRVKGNEEKKEGLPVWDEVNVTGLGFRGGLRIEFY